jgi:hypothetical protein
MLVELSFTSLRKTYSPEEKAWRSFQWFALMRHEP